MPAASSTSAAEIVAGSLPYASRHLHTSASLFHERGSSHDAFASRGPCPENCPAPSASSGRSFFESAILSGSWASPWARTASDASTERSSASWRLERRGTGSGIMASESDTSMSILLPLSRVSGG